MTTTALRDYAWRGSSCTVGALVGSDILATKTILVTDHEKTGENARRLRQQARVSLREVARRLGVSAAYLSDLERGRRGWDMQRACRFARAIGANKVIDGKDS
jgi:predicted transcriptional regulator